PKMSRAAAALHAEESAQRQALAALGFSDGREAQGVLAALSQSVGGPFSQHAPERLRQLAAPLLSDMAKSPDPDQALRLFADLDRSLRRHPGYYRLLAQAPPLRHRLIDLLGASEFLGRAILNFPELVDWLSAARDPGAHAERAPTEMCQEVDARLAKLDDLELRLRSLCRFKLQEQLRVGVLDLAFALPTEAVLGQLCAVAEACLGAALGLAREALADRLEAPVESGFAVLGMGRFGGREMGYGSDLDLLFIYDDTAAAGPSPKDAVRLAQRLIQMLTLRMSEGVLYPIDTRLRPSGAQGPLVSSATGFCTYHRERAMLWERQALLRARPVAGDLAFGARVLDSLADVRYPVALPPGAGLEIHRVRRRMERELAREAGARSNLKTGRGGLVDLEFAIQYLQLAHAHAHPSLRTPETVSALGALMDLGLVPPRRGRQLLAAYRFLRFLENRLRVVEDRPIAAVDFEGPRIGQLARRMGYGQRAPAVLALRRDYARVTQRVRRFYNAVLTPPAEA
ncbi:MAG TPA: bifunctional [glutamate--ammonia ligase]-adenylyl-L-tyrosine phosphorylase/[glutamate--ammonia-ligase] adenylyltransferase, partial [Myxococcota bacterium]|nr:bifunctional [glutamate--ammonia ligase]-adenylyl-L-tyrosine phosphorylase/[glutamate--ammonia-ligase] adenylyltransferase [Myxococcota bacterium]